MTQRAIFPTIGGDYRNFMAWAALCGANMPSQGSTWLPMSHLSAYRLTIHSKTCFHAHATRSRMADPTWQLLYAWPIARMFCHLKRLILILSYRCWRVLLVCRTLQSHDASGPRTDYVEMSSLREAGLFDEHLHRQSNWSTASRSHHNSPVQTAQLHKSCWFLPRTADTGAIETNVVCLN